MNRSWARLTFTGYEIKANRSDFVRDTKWPAYLPMCSELYFVTPCGLVSKDEVPEQCGLIEASKNGTRLYTRKKAQHREIECPEGVLVYILMSRSVIVPSRLSHVYIDDSRLPRAVRIDRWRERLGVRADGEALGRLVNEATRERIHEAQDKARRAERKVENLARLAKLVSEHGIDPEYPLKLERILKRVDGAPVDMARLLEVLPAMRRRMQDIRDAGETLMRMADELVERRSDG